MLETRAKKDCGCYTSLLLPPTTESQRRRLRLWFWDLTPGPSPQGEGWLPIVVQQLAVLPSKQLVSMTCQEC